jgi:hypothetical protein
LAEACSPRFCEPLIRHGGLIKSRLTVRYPALRAGSAAESACRLSF